MLSHKSVKNERQWKSVTGLSSEKFYTLCTLFSKEYEKIYELDISQISSNLKKDFLLQTNEDCLFFVLFQLKNALSYDSLALLIGTDGSNAQRNFERYLAILDLTLTQADMTPKRAFTGVAEFEEYLKEIDDIILDATEHLTQRPKGYDAQKEVYSGKKRHIHTKNS